MITRITVALSLPSKNGVNVPVSLRFNGDGAPTDAKGNVIAGAPLPLKASAANVPPTLNSQAIKSLIKAGKDNDADALVAAYQAAVDQYKADGGSTPQEAVAQAVFDYISDAFGIKAEDGQHPVLDPSKVVVTTATNVVGDTEISVTASPVWGGK